MKNYILVSIIGLFLTIPIFSWAQDQTAPNSNFYIGGQLSTGFFYPGDVNQYIKNYIKDNNIIIQSGVSDIYSNYNFSFTVGYKINPNFGLQAVSDFGFAMKYISVTNGDSKSFTFWRFSPGVIANLTIPHKSNTDFNFGAGLFYHIMGFENFSGSNIGWRLHMGYDVYINQLGIKPFIVFDYAKVSTGDAKCQTLNFTDVRFGIGDGLLHQINNHSFKPYLSRSNISHLQIEAMKLLKCK